MIADVVLREGGDEKQNYGVGFIRQVADKLNLSSTKEVKKEPSSFTIREVINFLFHLPLMNFRIIGALCVAGGILFMMAPQLIKRLIGR